MKFNELVKARYSCRKFDERHVEEEKLRYILEAGRLAPTAKNAQPVTVLVLKSEKSLDKLRALTQMTYNSRLVLVVCYDTSISWKATNYNDNFDSGDMDASIVATHMVLAAKDVGVDSLWARAFNASDVARAFELPENIHVACILDLGYASTVAGGPSPRHEARKQLEQFAREL